MIYPKEKKAPGWKHYRNCSLGISLESRNHVGEYFEAIVSWVNGKFDNCFVDLSDTLHRYNYMIDGLFPEEARQKATEEGTRWLEEHKPYLDMLDMPYRVLRWDHWMTHPDLPKNKEAFWRAYESDDAFNKAIMKDVAIYYERRRGQKLGQVSPRNIELSASYLLEELAVHSIIFSEYRCASIYPGRQQASFKLVREGRVENVPSGLENSYFVPLFLYNIEDDQRKSSNFDLRSIAA